MTVGADKAYDTAEFVRTCKAFGAEVHAARNTAGRRSNIGEEMAASEGYQASQVHRKRIEEVFGWVKTVARLSKTRHRGQAPVNWQVTQALAADTKRFHIFHSLSHAEEGYLAATNEVMALGFNLNTRAMMEFVPRARTQLQETVRAHGAIERHANAGRAIGQPRKR